MGFVKRTGSEEMAVERYVKGQYAPPVRYRARGWKEGRETYLKINSLN